MATMTFPREALETLLVAVAYTLRDPVFALRNQLVLECPWSLQCRTRQANASKLSWHATPNT